MSRIRKPYPSDVSDDEWTFIAPYLTLLAEDDSQRKYPLREVFNGLRYIVKTGAHWRMMPHDLPPWPVVYQQMRRWMAAGCFEAVVHDLRVLLRRAAERQAQPSAAILDSRTVQSTPESGTRAGYDGHKRRKGSKVHAAVDTLGHLLALVVTPADEQDRAQVGELTQALQAATGESVELAFVDQGYTGDAPAEAAQAHGSNWPWSSCPRPKAPNRASCCCPNAGSLNAISPGPPAFGAWLAITSDWPPPWQDFIFSRSPVLCYISSPS